MGAETNRHSRRLILVTGCPRSGTTAVGEVLSSAPASQYLYEPMNLSSGDEVIQHYFEVPGTDDFPFEVFDDLVLRMRSLKLDLKPGVFESDRGLYKIAKTVIGGRSKASLWRCRLQPGLRNIIWKDPLAASAAVAAAERHDIPVLVTVRPIHAIAASFKRMGWGFGLVRLQKDLEAQGLIAPMDLPHEHSENSAMNGAMLSVMLYSALAKAAARTDRIRFVSVDDIIGAPHDTYRRVFDWAGLIYSSSVEATVDKMYRSRPGAGDMPSGDRAHSRNNSLASVNRYWRRLLSDEEIDAIERMSAAVDLSAIDQFSLSGSALAVANGPG
ncbi:MAG: hypothetical protein AAF253_04710 [Pseudomonadota bacterium]